MQENIKYDLKPSSRTPESLRDIYKNETIQIILDYSQSIDPYIHKTLKRWQASLEKRNPSPIYTEGPDGLPLYSGTDIDLFGFFMALVARRAIINIPKYARRTPTVQRSDEWRLTESPHGQVFGLISKEKAHSFSIKIKDFGVLRKRPDGIEKLGNPRNIMIVDYFGRLYPGCTEIEFTANDRERELLKRYGLPYEETEKIFKGKPFVFKHFVFPSLWKIFYSSDYIIPKILTQRCKIEGELYRQRTKYLTEQGINLPIDELTRPVKYYRPPEEKKGRIKVKNLTAKLFLPKEEPKDHKSLPIISMEKNGEIKKYSKWPANKRELQGILRYSINRAKDMSWGLGAQIRSVSRAIEYAMFLYGFKGERIAGNELLPEWSDGWQSWKRGLRAIAISANFILAYHIGEYTITQKEQEFEVSKGILLEDMEI